MTGTGTTTPETLSSPPPPRRVLTAAGLTVFAAVALTPWLLTTSSQTEPSLMGSSITAATGALSRSGQRPFVRARRRAHSSVCPALSEQPHGVPSAGARDRLRPVLREQPVLCTVGKPQ
jgi:hypothetical protein